MPLEMIGSFIVGTLVGLVIGAFVMTMLIQGKLASQGVFFKDGVVDRVFGCGTWLRCQRDGIGFMPDKCRFLPDSTTPTHVVVNNMSKEEFKTWVEKVIKTQNGGGTIKEQMEEIAK